MALVRGFPAIVQFPIQNAIGLLLLSVFLDIFLPWQSSRPFLMTLGTSGEELFDQFRTFVENFHQIFQYDCAIKTVSYRAPRTTL